jgi:ornithine cyclodeaminase/alanine dehydrogenase-like protein (mu-crystallin family)
LGAAVEAGTWSWSRAVEIGAIVGKAAGRQKADDITLFESQRLALEDVAVASEPCALYVAGAIR